MMPKGLSPEWILLKLIKERVIVILERLVLFPQVLCRPFKLWKVFERNFRGFVSLIIKQRACIIMYLSRMEFVESSA